VASPSRTHTFLGDRYRRLSHRRGNKRAIVAVDNSVLTIVWHLLSDPTARLHHRGPGYHESRINSRHRHATSPASSNTPPASTSPLNPPPNSGSGPPTEPGYAGCLRPARTRTDFRVSR
jgi:hypothetical protein